MEFFIEKSVNLFCLGDSRHFITSPPVPVQQRLSNKKKNKKIPKTKLRAGGGKTIISAGALTALSWAALFQEFHEKVVTVGQRIIVTNFVSHEYSSLYQRVENN